MTFSKLNIKLVILAISALNTAILILLFVFFSPIITQSIANYPEFYLLIIIITLRIVNISACTLYMFYKWFQQERQYFSDVPFLFAMFFYILIFGKGLDLWWDLVYYYIGEDIVLIILKIRFLIILMELLPMMYLGFGIILFALSVKKKSNKLADQEAIDKIRLKLVVLLFVLETSVVILGPNHIFISNILPIIAIPSLIMIIYVMYLAYKQKVLSEVNPLILTIGFTLILISQFVRPMFLNIFGEEPIYLICAEFFDLGVFGVISMGFIKRKNRVVIHLKQNWKKYGYIASIVAPIQYIVFTALSMFFYTGGTQIDSSKQGYSFWENFFSDLGRTVSLSGTPNTISFTIFSISALILALSISFFFSASSYFFKFGNRKGISTGMIYISGFIMGILLILVVITPWDLYPDTHIVFSNLFSAFSLLVMALLSILILRNQIYPNKFAYLYMVVIAFAFIYTILSLFGPPTATQEGLFIQAGFQKISQYTWLIILAIQGYGALRLSKKHLLHNEQF